MAESPAPQRLPFEVTIYDCDMKEHKVVVWLEIADADRTPDAVGWDSISDTERIAKDDIIANVDVSIHVESLLTPGKP